MNQDENIYQAPQADLARADGSIEALQHFKRFSSWGVVFLSMITLGIYSLYWLVSRTRSINAYHERKIPTAITWTLVILWVITLPIGITLGFFNPEFGGSMPQDLFSVLNTFVAIANLLYFVFAVYLIFAMRSRLKESINPNIGPILTFFFNVIYLQYKINEAFDKQNEPGFGPTA